MAAMPVWKDVRSPHAVHSRVRPGGLRPLQARAPHGPCAAQSRGSQGKFRPLRASVSRGLSLSTRASFWSTGTARTRRMATEQYAAEDLLLGGGSNETADNASSHEKVSSAQLEGMFQEFFRMGAAVAIGELYDEGMLGDKNAVAYDVRDYLESFGIASFDEVCRLGITGPYLEDFKRIFAENASFPPAA